MDFPVDDLLHGNINWESWDFVDSATSGHYVTQYPDVSDSGLNSLA